MKVTEKRFPDLGADYVDDGEWCTRKDQMKPTAASRTLPMFGAPDMAEQPHEAPPPTGSPVKKVPMRQGPRGTFAYRPANHLRQVDAKRTLCGLTIRSDGGDETIDGTYELVKDTGGLGLCLSCRAEASKIGAVIA